MPDLESPSSQQFMYVTTTGRRSGRPHEIEIWFGMDKNTVYLLAGGGQNSDTVRNIKANPSVTVRLGSRTFSARGRVLGSGREDKTARRLLLEKYQPDYSEDLTDWAATALPVAIDLGDEIS